uniref:G-protein coupled receptors family 1 profile domain-containing protein n=1 Tax=Trichuris muris TaxID=70415 RepID=A0A5S6QFF1_TRIMR
MDFNRSINFDSSNTTAAHVIYLLETILMACGGMVGMLTNLALFRSVRCSRLFHANVRLLLLHSIVACEILCAHQVIHGIVGGMSIANHVFNVGVTKKTCILVQAPSVASFLVFSICIAAIGAERLLATLKNRYDDKERSSTAVRVFVTVTWAGGILNALLFLLVRNQETVVQYCSLFLLSFSPLLYVTCGFYCMIATSTVIVYWVTYKLNSTRVLAFSINTATHSLQERFQLRNNISITYSLLPCVLCSSITVFLAFGTLTTVSAFFVQDRQLNIWLVNCYLLILNLLCTNIIVQPIVLLRRCQKLRLLKFDWRYSLFPWVRLKDSNRYPCDHKTSVVQFHVNPDSHEALLQTFWSSKSRVHQCHNSTSRSLCCGLISSNERDWQS